MRPLHHEVDEVTAAAEAAGDQDVSQESEEPSQVDVLILLVLLLVHDGLLFLSKRKRREHFNLVIDQISSVAVCYM